MPWWGVKVEIDKLPDLYDALRNLADTKVLVGIPEERTPRKAGPINNAAIGYIQEHGDSLGRIPARPWLVPPVAAMKQEIAERLKRIGVLALEAKPDQMNQAYHALGLTGQNKVRAYFGEGIPPPLATSTLLGRIRARTAIKGAKTEIARRKVGPAPGETMEQFLLAGMDIAKPLIATGQLRNSVTYVIQSVAIRSLQTIGKEGSWEKWRGQFKKT